MEILDPTTVTDDELKQKLWQIADETIFSYEFLVQLVRSALMEDEVIVFPDPAHYISLRRNTIEVNTPEEIEAFILKWAGSPP